MDGRSDALFATENAPSFRSSPTEEELNLLQFPSGCVAQLCTGAAQVRWQLLAALLCKFPDDMPDDWREARYRVTINTKHVPGFRTS